MTNKNILQEAQEIIYGDREGTYGEPSVNLVRIANYWNAHLTNLGYAVRLTAEDVCIMMSLLKFARQTHQHKRDNLVDAAGYIALIERLQE